MFLNNTFWGSSANDDNPGFVALNISSTNSNMLPMTIQKMYYNITEHDNFLDLTITVQQQKKYMATVSKT